MTSAQDKLVTDNMGLVNMVVRRFVGQGTDYEDLMQIGSIGLIKAAKRFDESKNLKFSTYAVAKILGELKTYFRDNGSIKISRTQKEKMLKIKKAIAFLEGEGCYVPSISEISKVTGISPEEIVETMEIKENVLSLDMESEQGGTLYEAVGEDRSEQNMMRIMLEQALDKLSVKERQIIVMRYYMDKTQMQVANALSMSQVSVSRMEKNILKKLSKMIS